MNNPLHLRLVEPILPQPAQPLRSAWAAGTNVTGDEEDIEAMLEDPVADLVRDLDRVIARRGPLSPDMAVRATRQVAQAVIYDGEIRRYAVGTTHVMWLGSVLYFALTGAAPLAPRAGSISPSRPPLVSSASSFVITPDIERIVATCLSPSPKERFRTVADLDRALGALPEAAATSSEPAETELELELDDDVDDADDADTPPQERPTIPPASGVTLTKAASAPTPRQRRAGGVGT